MMRSSLFILLTILPALMVAAFPLDLDKRAPKKKCLDNGLPPCACNNELGLRRSSLKCPAKTFGFKDKVSVSDGTLKEFSSKAGFDTQCDHIVELQYIASKIDKEICDVFLADNAKFQQFFDFINNTPRLVNVEGVVNNAKGVLFSTTPSGKPKKFKKTTKKAANGLASYLQLVKDDAKDIANDINAEMNRLVSGTRSSGFTNFESDYTAKLSGIITDAKQQALRLANAPVTFTPPSSSSATTSAPSAPTSSSVPSSKKRPAPGSPHAPPPPAKKPKTNAPAPPPPTKKPKVTPTKPPVQKKKPATKTTTKKVTPKKKTRT